ncbi:hypothetical protein [Cytobacillus firmus]|uniref:hypothetical protein n=1 Tax=Cytobacillus firmus TaxID=1399 RepID=UPI0021CA62F2|nr:hypothetical protein [Cytobacillus firmus]
MSREEGEGKMKLVSLLSGKGFVMYNKELAHKVSVNGAIIFGQLCSSYESFGNKEMLTIRDGKEYFFLTAETLEETALTYKQQMKAVKELEQAGYIETRIMGVPSKKYFHIKDKIVHELLSSSDKRENLVQPTNPILEGQNDSTSYDKKEYLALSKGSGKDCQKGSSIKKKNKKEQYKDKKEIIDNYQEPITNSLNPSQFKSLLINAANEFYTTFSTGRYSKKQWNNLIDKFANETVENGRYKNVSEEKIRGYAYKSLEKMCDHTDYKRSDDFADYTEIMQELAIVPNRTVPFYNWLEEERDELPY